MDNLLVALNCVLPVFTMLAAGYFAKSRGIVSEEIVPQLNRLCFSVLLSLYMFSSVYSADFSRAFSPRLVLFLVAQTLLLFVIGFFVISKTVPDAAAAHICRRCFAPTLPSSALPWRRP